MHNVFSSTNKKSVFLATDCKSWELRPSHGLVRQSKKYVLKFKHLRTLLTNYIKLEISQTTISGRVYKAYITEDWHDKFIRPYL